MPITTTHTAAFMAQVEAGEIVRRNAHEAEACRQELSGFGVDLRPFVSMTKAEKRAEAAARAARYASPEAVLKRSLLSAAEAGSFEAERLLAAASRGDANWQDRARSLLTQAQRAA